MIKFFLILTLALALASAETTEDKEDMAPEEIIEEIKASDDTPGIYKGRLLGFSYYNTVHGPHRDNSHGDNRPPNFAPSNIGYEGGDS